MNSMNSFRRHQSFLFFILTMFLSSPALAEDRTALTTKPIAGAQVSGIDVKLEQVSGTAILSTKTDEKGNFTFSDVAPGSYKLRIGCEKPGQAAPESSQKCYTEVRIVITEKSSGVITGTIRKES